MKTDLQMLNYWVEDKGLDHAIESYLRVEDRKSDFILERAVANYILARDILKFKIKELENEEEQSA